MILILATVKMNAVKTSSKKKTVRLAQPENDIVITQCYIVVFFKSSFVMSYFERGFSDVFTSSVSCTYSNETMCNSPLQCHQDVFAQKFYSQNVPPTVLQTVLPRRADPAELKAIFEKV